MTGLDWILLTNMSLFTVIFFLSGLVRHVLGIGVLLVGIYTAWLFGGLVGSWLEAWVVSPTGRVLLGYGGIFAAVMLGGVLLGKVITYLIAITGLRMLDRFLGGLTGLLLSWALCWIVLTALKTVPMTPSVTEAVWWQQSAFVPLILLGGDQVWNLLQPEQEQLEELQVRLLPSSLNNETTLQD